MPGTLIWTETCDSTAEDTVLNARQNKTALRRMVIPLKGRKVDDSGDETVIRKEAR